MTVLLVTASARSETFNSGKVISVAGDARNLATADFNRDGKADVVYQDARTGGNLHIMLSNGDGTFSAGQVFAVPLGTGACITVGDVNNDGVADLVVGYDGVDQSASNTNPYVVTVLVGNGDGTFQQPIASPATSPDEPEEMLYHVGIADFDGDGFPDIAYSDSEMTVFFLRGDGSGRFTPMPRQLGDGGYQGTHGITIPAGADVVAVDLNGDGRPDIVAENFNGMSIALNQGGASFPTVTNPELILNNGTTPGAFLVQDVNGDGIPDIILQQFYGQTLVYAGTGGGNFAKPVAKGGEDTAYSIVALTDLNGDGRPDIVLSTLDGFVSFLQGADGSFSAQSRQIYAPGDFGTNEALFADFDGDGRGDIVSGGTNALILTKGRSDGTFQAAASYTAGSIEDVVPVDLNKDSNIDVVLEAGGDSYYGVASTWGGQADGTFGNMYAQYFAAGAHTNGRSAIADFDGDGNPDVFNGGLVFYGDGTGISPAISTVADVGGNNLPGGFVAVADFNEDGRPDGITTSIDYDFGATSYLSIGLSSVGGTYSSTTLALGEAPGPMATGDFNHDGHTDLAVLGETKLYILAGDGKGNLAVTQTYDTGFSIIASNSYTFTDLEAADLDGDGNADLVVPMAGSSMLEIYYGRGDGTFEAPVKMPLSDDTWYATVADLNSDGLPDLILSGHGLVRVLHGAGGRAFSATEDRYAAGVSTGKVRVADLNHDGVLDLLVPNGGANHFYYPGTTFTVLLSQNATVSPDVLIATMKCAPEPSSYQQAFTCTASFVPKDNSAKPTGMVTLSIDGQTSGQAQLAGSTATFNVASTLGIGGHQVEASFPGDSVFKAATAFTTHTVSKLGSSVLLTAAPATLQYGSSTTLSATVTGSLGGATGNVAFYDSATLLVTVAVGANGNAVLPVASLAVGIHAIVAIYSGDSEYQGSTSAAVSVEVDGEVTTTSLTASPLTAFPSQPIVFTAKVSSSTAVSAGAVTLYEGSAVLGSGTVDGNGSAVLSLTTLAIGSHVLFAKYGGSSTLAQSVSNTVTVHVVTVPTTITVVGLPNPSYQGQVVQFMATVGSPAGAQQAIGTVQFYDGSTLLGAAATDATGAASLRYSFTTAGVHEITAAYVATGAFQASTSALYAQTVLASDFTVTLDPSNLTLQTQHHGDVNVTVSAIGNFNTPVELSCGSIPAYATCSFRSGSEVTDELSGPKTVDLYIDTSELVGYESALHGSGTQRRTPWLAALAFPLAVMLFAGRRKRRRWIDLGVMGIALICAGGMIGCSGKVPHSVQPGTYVIPIVAQSAGVTHTVSLNLVVTP